MNVFSLWKGILTICAYLGFFWFAGAALPEKFHKNSFSSLCLIGFFVYYTAFEFAALPMKLFKQPLSHLTGLWSGILLLLFIYVLVFRTRSLWQSLRGIFSGKKKVLWGCLFLLLSWSVALFLAFNINHISEYDAGYYIGLPVSSVYSNTIECMDPYSGSMLSEPSLFYILNTNTIHSAVIFQAINLHPLVELKFTLTAVMAFLFELLLYKMGILLFKKSYKKAWIFTFLATLCLLFSYSIAGVSHYFAYRTYEGKSICAYFYMTGILVFFCSIWKNKDDWGWAGLFFVSCSGIAFCNTALFTIPALTGSLLLPYVLRTLSLRSAGKSLIVLAPCLFWAALHFLL